MHGLGATIERLWQKTDLPLPRLLAWFLTFNFVNICWVFFRASSFREALDILKGMAGINGMILPYFFSPKFPSLESFGVTFGAMFQGVGHGITILPILFVALCVVVFTKNSIELKNQFEANSMSLVFVGMVMVCSVLSLNRVSEFLYFQF